MSRFLSIVSASVIVGAAMISAAGADDLPVLDQIKLFNEAKQAGLIGVARKTKPVIARHATPGEIVVSIIPGEGVETKSKPAEEGDWVVRSTCSEDSYTDILVKAAKFPERYGEAQDQPDKDGYSTYHPTGVEMEYFIVAPATGSFTFVAPWGEKMLAKPGDAIVQTPTDANDTYRIARSAFDCTYEVVKPAKE